jgi:TPR repeat protein
MFRLLFLIIIVGLIGACGMGVFWYLNTPQPIGAYAQGNYARQMITYEYLEYKRDRYKDDLGYWIPFAQKGNGPAETRVAELYFTRGDDNPDNYKVAVTYLTRAAALGLPVAQNALGVALRNGLGIAQDKVEAYKWFSLAARQGLKLAQKNLDDLTPELTDKERDQAALRVDLWLKNIKKF